MTRRRLLVVGNGMAGARLVEDVVARDPTRRFDIVIVGDEPHGNYNRILLSGVLAGTHRTDDIMINPVSWYAANGVRLRTGTRVEAVDTRRREVRAADGSVEPYDVLVLATGSRPALPPIDGLVTDAGTLKNGAFVFRTIEDCDRILARAREARRAVVIGGGLLGLEAARGLRNHGLDVQVVHLSPHVMDAQLDAQAGRILQRQLEAMGLQLLTARSTAALIGGDRVRGLRFADNQTLACDMVVVTAGIRPNVELAVEAGLDVERGILVGDDLACRPAPHVYAIGECSQHGGQVYGLVAPLWEQARVLADRLTGHDPGALYTGSRLTTRLKVAGVDVAVMGVKEPLSDEDEVISYAEPARGVYKKLIVHDDRLAGAILIGDGAVVPSISQAFVRAAPLAGRRSEILFPIAHDRPPRTPEELSDDAQVCDCNGVSKARIIDAVLRGARSLHAVSDQTRAGTGCGACRPQLQQVIDMACRSVDDPGLLGPAQTTGATTHSAAPCGGVLALDGHAPVSGGGHAGS
jgi:nitrite reductase (NADH) large subunit